MKVLVTGASGLLGRCVVRALSADHDITPAVHSTPIAGGVSVDIRDPRRVEELFERNRFDACVHCAAKTRVGDCERDPEGAFQVNFHGSANIARACARLGTKLVHVSTDFVFAGSADAGYAERDVGDPLQVYGRSKLAAERAAFECPGSAVVRVGLLYGFNGPLLPGGWPLEVATKIRAGGQVRTNSSDIRQPTLIDDVAAGIVQIVALGLSGPIHLGGPHPMTKLDWALMVAGLMDCPASSVCDDGGQSDGIFRPHRAWLRCERSDMAAMAPRTTPIDGTTAVLRAAGIIS